MLLKTQINTRKYISGKFKGINTHFHVFKNRKFKFERRKRQFKN